MKTDTYAERLSKHDKLLGGEMFGVTIGSGLMFIHELEDSDLGNIEVELSGALFLGLGVADSSVVVNDRPLGDLLTFFVGVLESD